MSKDPRTRGEDDIWRVIAIQCSYASMIAKYLAGKLYRGELHSITGYLRLFLQGKLVGPVWHATIGTSATTREESVAELLLIHSLNANGRGVFRGDKVYNAFTQTVWEMFADPQDDPDLGHGESIEQWIEYKRTPAASDPTDGWYIPLSNGDPAAPGYLFTSTGVGILIFVTRN